jgi:multiple sugar transport system ATP-binding protein
LLVVTLDPSNEELIARIGRDTALRSGDRFDIALDAAAIHLFDSATTKAIVQAS